LGVCTYLIDKLALRVGNEKGEDEADTVGCCSLRVEHIRFEAENKITLDFLGKDSMRYLNTVPVEPIVYKLLHSFTSSKKPDEDIFDRINPGKLNDFLKNFMDDLSAKVFRTYNASITLQ
jgi:DNA topoisomerase-1